MRKRDENKEFLVRQKALEMLVGIGFDGFSMQKLAKEVGVSPATLYIYYKDKEDLIIQLGIEEGQKMMAASLHNFDPQMNFEAGLRLQWENRSHFWINNPLSTKYFEQIKHSPYADRVVTRVSLEFKEIMQEFVHNAQQHQELINISIEAFWTIAFAPLYSLIYFHQTGKSVGNRPFSLNKKVIDEVFSLVIKALKP
jgi:AcrR family transcriptional regulator